MDTEQKLGIMSSAFLLENNSEAIIWRGPKKTGTAVLRIFKNKAKI
ncbi:hypothetical protein [Thiolapillus sp.]